MQKVKFTLRKFIFLVIGATLAVLGGGMLVAGKIQAVEAFFSGIVGFLLSVVIAGFAFPFLFRGNGEVFLGRFGIFFFAKLAALVSGGAFYYMFPEFGSYIAYSLSFLFGIFLVTGLGILVAWNVDVGGRFVRS